MIGRRATARAACVALVLAACHLPVAHAAGPPGIACVQAPEAATGVCTGSSPDEAFACARRDCARAGVKPAQCLRVAWCFPAGRSSEVFVQDHNGLHWQEFSCGWPGRSQAEAAAALRCDRTQRPQVAACEVVRVFGPDGAVVAR